MDLDEVSLFIDDFAKLAEKISKFGNRPKLHPDYLFRGQSDAQWSLEPSFAQVANQLHLDRNESLQLEWESVVKFSMSAKNLLPLTNTLQLSLSPGHIDLAGWGPLMQHYGAPTRQLDWSISPWVALYFSCCEKDELDGALWIADFKKVDEVAKKKLADLEPKANPEKVFFKLLRESSAPEIVVFSMPTTSNERIDAQQGRFSLCTNPLADHAHEICAASGLEKVVIRKSMKSQIMEELYKMNVSAAALFPGIDGLGRTIRDFCKLWDKRSRIIMNELGR
jgi:hypothetical protein